MNPKSYQLFALLSVTVFLSACGAQQQAVDAQLESEIQKIRAIDNHAHPVRIVAKGEAPDRGYDALPVENLEAGSDPLQYRPTNPAFAEAARTMYGGQSKAQTIEAKGEGYPAWVLDQWGVEVMLANRVEMGPSIQPPRFRWAGYVDSLMFPFDNSKLAQLNSDRKTFFGLNDAMRKKYFDAAGITAPPATLDEYLSRVVTPTLEKHKQGGAVAEKYESAYLRSLAVDKVDRATADRAYSQLMRGVPDAAEYKPLQDFLFRFIAAECGRLGMAVHLHVSAGGGSYFDVSGTNPLLLEPVLNDPELRKTSFVLVHGGWPYIREATALMSKPNAYLDFSNQPLLVPPETLARNIREWLEFVPEKVMFGTDAFPATNEMGWEETGWVLTRNSRRALGLALTAMMRDGSITRERAVELARMVLRENAKKLYGI